MKVIAKTNEGEIIEVKLQRMFPRLCKVEGCYEKHYGLGYCRNHNTQFKKYGDPLINLKNELPTRKNRKCVICHEPHFVYGYCKRHYRQEFRKRIIIELGGKCIVCGEIDMDVLERDHIENDGYKHRREKRGYQSWEEVEQIFKKINTVDFKKKYQVLCRNCNWKKHLYNMEFKRLEKHNLVGF